MKTDSVIESLKAGAPVIALIFTVIGATWFLAHRMATTRADVVNIEGTVADLGKTVDTLSGTVTDLSETVTDLSGTVDTLSASTATLNTLNNTVQTLNATVEVMSGTVRTLDASMDAMNVTFPLLVSCVIDLHGPWMSNGVDEQPYRYRDFGDSRVLLPSSCNLARQRMNEQAASGNRPFR